MTLEMSQTSLQTPVEVTKQGRFSPVGDSNAQLPLRYEWSGATALHALIIGINEYPKLTPLEGAVADAERMVTFLSDINVPKENIVTLYDQHASRKAIIEAFQDLQKNSRIHKDDPILIFYAGHGGLAEALPEWKQRYGTNKIQVIFPYDYELPDANASEPVNCIPDTTIATLLNKLAEEKGTNITVIFDSCHSASGTRDELERPGLRARSAEITLPITPDIDDDILPNSSLESKIGRGSDLILYSHQASHIHIAACGSIEKAWEDNGSGLFTTALLNILRKSRVDNISYENLIKMLPELAMQSPHCYGQNRGHILFDSRLGTQAKVFIPVTCAFKAGQCELQLQAGDESGVTEGSVWDLHESATENSSPEARVIAGFPDICATSLDPQGEQDARWLAQLAKNASGRTEIRMYARRLHAGQGTELKVWCSSEDIQALLPAETSNAINGTTGEFGYVIHGDRNTADLELEIYPSVNQVAGPSPDSQVLFRLHDRIAEEYGVAELKLRKSAVREEIETILFAFAKWNWHRHRTNWDPAHTTPQIEPMTMVKVATRVGATRRYLETPMVMTGNSNGVIEFCPQKTDLYGIQLTSRSKLPLYIRMFYFDATDFSIGDLFGHGVARGQEDATLPAGGTLMIGDGQDGGSPLRFPLSPGNKVELGYLKVFWCTRPLELSDLAQKTPFKMRPGTVGRAVGRAEFGSAEDWGTLDLKLVMKAE